jgi:hypothetical protein
MIGPFPPSLGIGLIYSRNFKAKMGIGCMNELHR